jgi:RHS repeat-associated protein
MLTVNTGSATVTATYDALGRMVENNAGGSYTEIIYGPTGKKLATCNGLTLVKAFIALPGGAKAIYKSTGLTYYRHSDWLGSSRLTSTATKPTSMYSSTAYAPFGEVQINQTSGTADASFTGQDQDTVSSLYDFPFRRYSQSQGRWISPDPAGVMAVGPASPQTWNRYAYVNNNPLAWIDPYGLCGEVVAIQNGDARAHGDCDPPTDGGSGSNSGSGNGGGGSNGGDDSGGDGGSSGITGGGGGGPSGGGSTPCTVAVCVTVNVTADACDDTCQLWNMVTSQPIFLWVFQGGGPAANTSPQLVLKAVSDCPTANGREIDYALQDSSGNPVLNDTVVEHQTDTSRASSPFGPGTSYETTPAGTVAGFQDTLNPGPFQQPGNSIQTFTATTSAPSPNATQQPVMIQSVNGQMNGSLGIWFQFPQVFVNGVPTPTQCVFPK